MLGTINKRMDQTFSERIVDIMKAKFNIIHIRCKSSIYSVDIVFTTKVIYYKYVF